MAPSCPVGLYPELTRLRLNGVDVIGFNTDANPNPKPYTLRLCTPTAYKSAGVQVGACAFSRTLRPRRPASFDILGLRA